MLLSLHDVVNGGFRRLRARLPDELEPQGPAIHLFSGFDGTGGAGADVSIIAKHPDGRQLSWMVEIWIDRFVGDDNWYATVKGEIDLDDDEGDDYCIVNEQRSVDSGQQAADAIRELAAIVADYPLPKLLAMRWSPEDHELGDDSAEPIGSVTRTVTVTSKRPDANPPT